MKSIGLYSMVKEVVYDLFTNNIEQSRVTDSKLSESIGLIREYCTELQIHGYVKFDMPV